MSSLVVRWSNLAFAFFLAPLLGVSCTGAVSPTGGRNNASIASGGSASVSVGSGGGATGTMMSTGGAAPTTVVTNTTPPVAESAGQLVIRRLTHREFNNTVLDLLGDTTSPADSWAVEDGSSNSGFQAPNVVDMTTFQFLEPSVTTIAENAIAQNKVTIPCTNPTAGAMETTCATNFIKTFGRRAYRRPVADGEVTDLLAVFTAAHTAPISYDFKTSIAQVIKAMLLSPNFLYHHWEVGPTKPSQQGNLVALTPYQLASRLSYLLWESMPDETLLAAADAGQLSTPDQIATQAQRLLADKTHAANAMYNFHVQWLQYPNLDAVTKNTMVYPFFNDSYRAALVPEINSFVSSVMLDGDGTLKTLLTAPYAFANNVTAVAYGAKVTGSAMARIDLDPATRAGILTQSAFLSTSGAPSGSFPIRRGLIILGQLMCGTIRPPPGNIQIPDLPAVDGTTIKTTRQANTVHDTMPCAVCHKDFDPLGYAFENYDGVGAYRTTENGQAIDATGTGITPQAKQAFSFTNALDLINFLANSDEVKTCVGRQWFRYLLGRMEGPEDEGSIETAVLQARANPNYSVRDLLIGMVKSMAFRMRSVNAGEPS